MLIEDHTLRMMRITKYEITEFMEVIFNTPINFKTNLVEYSYIVGGYDDARKPESIITSNKSYKMLCIKNFGQYLDYRENLDANYKIPYRFWSNDIYHENCIVMDFESFLDRFLLYYFNYAFYLKYHIVNKIVNSRYIIDHIQVLL
jgi:hypothetical protein